jgi:glycosyltransferase involved in cell wall biosynthesis
VRRGMNEQPMSVENSPKPRLLCFSHLRWHFVTQRPQHLMRRAARDFDVVFVEEAIFDAEASRLDVERSDGVTIAVPHLRHDLPPDDHDAEMRRLLQPWTCRRVVVCWYYTPAALPFTRHIGRAVTVYDNMDELSAFAGAPPYLLEFERELLGQADLVFTGGRSLFEAKCRLNDDVHCFPSSIDVAHFARARTRDGEDPADQAGIPHPRLGFFGVIDERMDLAFLAGLAALRPHWHFVMIGPVVKIDAATLPRRDNIHWLGMKDYAALPRYMSHWDLALMPFALNEATRFISPTKTPEFLAGGLPVVSTPVIDVVRGYGEDGLVAIAATPTAAAAAAATLMRSPAPDWLARVDARLREGSWDRTWEAMRELIADKHRPEATAHPRHLEPELTVEG